MTRRAGDPFSNNHFHVEIAGISSIDFSEVILPQGRAEIVEYREGGESVGHKIAGTIHVSNLVLRRGVTQSNELFQWWQNIVDGVADRRDVAVILLDEQRQPIKRWLMPGIWPASFVVSPLIAVGEAVTLVESVECAVERFTVE